MKAILAAAAAVAALTAASAASAQSALFECTSDDDTVLENLTRTTTENLSDGLADDITTHYAPGGLRVFGFPAAALSVNSYEDAHGNMFTLRATLNASSRAVLDAAERVFGLPCTQPHDSTADRLMCMYPANDRLAGRVLWISLDGDRAEVVCRDIW